MFRFVSRRVARVEYQKREGYREKQNSGEERCRNSSEYVHVLCLERSERNPEQEYKKGMEGYM
jgi:hypothetical protein